MKFEDYFLYGFFSDKGLSVFMVMLIVAMIFVALRIEMPSVAVLMALVLYVIGVALWLLSFVLVSQLYNLFS